MDLTGFALDFSSFLNNDDEERKKKKEGKGGVREGGRNQEIAPQLEMDGGTF